MSGLLKWMKVITLGVIEVHLGDILGTAVGTVPGTVPGMVRKT